MPDELYEVLGLFATIQRVTILKGLETKPLCGHDQRNFFFVLLAKSF
jgi:hypothetical protein